MATPIAGKITVTCSSAVIINAPGALLTTTTSTSYLLTVSGSETLELTDWSTNQPNCPI